MTVLFKNDVPHWTHTCKQCKFLFSVYSESGGYADVYLSCDDGLSSAHYLIKLSNDACDYDTPDLESLVYGYLIAHKAPGFITI